jgi:hypothetical protein
MNSFVKIRIRITVRNDENGAFNVLSGIFFKHFDVTYYFIRGRDF